MGLIPEDTVHEIRERADIVAVIGDHVSLRKAGRNHKGLCPFHHEKTPSFNVNGDKRFFYCFGCQKKGDVFTFVMEYEGKSFTEAAETLASRFGISIPESRPESPALRRQRGERSRMLEINALATEFFAAVLRDPERGAPGRAYLAERGIDEATANSFQLGYAPDQWRELGEFLERKRVPAELAAKVGLLVKQPRAGGYYDRFRHRLMCPVVMPGGEVAGFSGRLLPSPEQDEDDERKGAKYINSPESPVYKKSRLLFGLHLARDAFREKRRAVLVEGNFDVIHMHQHGFAEAVAPLGTALTDEQIGQLRRLADEVVLLYDGDKAGRAATLKALEALVASDTKVRIAALPAGADPDSMLLTGRVQELAESLTRAQPAIEYFVHDVWTRSARSADGRSEALDEAARLLVHVTNPTKRDLIIDTIANGMSVSPELVRRAMQRGNQRGDQRNQGRHRDADERRFEQPPPPQPPAAPVQPPPREELNLLAILADHPDLLEVAEDKEVVSFLTDGRLRDIYFAARQGSSMLSSAPEDIGPLIAKYVLAGTYASVEDPAHCLDEALQRLRAGRSRTRLQQLQKQAYDARRRGDVALERRLVGEILKTRRQVD
ncbi:DNA primase [Haliangium ochraceum DSM 14365]|uniref:DNA primase n=2 Tax=Haliangium ochraceum TaxID=80816 RepID=D0LP35_HALO1|nr:DNA primase [Haliangium ochraceum DSM 14365]